MCTFTRCIWANKRPTPSGYATRYKLRKPLIKVIWCRLHVCPFLAGLFHIYMSLTYVPAPSFSHTAGIPTVAANGAMYMQPLEACGTARDPSASISTPLAAAQDRGAQKRPAPVDSSNSSRKRVRKGAAKASNTVGTTQQLNSSISRTCYPSLINPGHQERTNATATHAWY